MNMPRGFRSGTLRSRVEKAARAALQSGALEPIHTEVRYCVDARVRFLVRVVRRKTLKQLVSTVDYEDPTRANPFLPYDAQLYVADASATHVCVLNKYNVVDNHLLIITRKFEHQETVLTKADFVALWKCMAEYDSLGFYNSGTVAGASQPHKHLQVVPLPLAESKPPVPIEILWDQYDGPSERITTLDRLPFAHQIVFWPDRPGHSNVAAAARTLELYRQMLQRAGLRQVDMPPSSGTSARVSGPYNLLVTRRWMLLVPRQRESFHGISLNALAFAGALLVHTPEQYAQLVQAGPMTALCHVATP